MLKWLLENISTIVISAILIIIVSAIVCRLIKNKRSGKHSCGCGCENCSAECSCCKK